MRLSVSQVRTRVEQSLLQVCNAAYGNKDLACKTMRTLLRKCLIDDDHSICVRVSGEYCPCHIDKGMRDASNRFLIKTGKGGVVHAMQAILETTLDKEYNAYLCAERMAQAAKDSGCDAFVAAPRISSCKRKTGDQTENQPEDPKDSVAVDSQNSGDPLQPYVSQLTHPLAIKILMDFIQSKDLASAVGKHCFCVNTSFVESFHNVILIYAPKRKHFHNSGYDTRVYLSALDWGENITRPHIVNLENPKTKKWLPKKTYNFQLRVVETLHGDVMWAVPK